MRKLSVLLCAVALSASAVACGGDDIVEPPKDVDFDGVLDSVDQCDNQPETRNNVFDLDGCPDNISDLYAPVRSDVETFWTTFFPTLYGRFYTPISRMQLFTGTTTSLCGGASSGPFYCGFDTTMYLETNFMANQIATNGDFAAAVVIAHEIGHHTQRLRGILGTTFSIQIELQADCLAGAWAASAGARGLLEPGDFQEAARLMFQIGDPSGTPWFAPGAHGTSQQRQQAFSSGFVSGAFICG